MLVAQNSVTVTDENGNATTEDYTPLGLLEKIYLNNDTSDVVGTYTYTTSSNALIAKYYRGVNPVAMVTKSSGTLTPYYYHYDEKGSITKLTDKSGTLAQSYTYDAFGNLSTDDDAIYNPIRYTGQYTDSETGLVYLRNRYYDPSIGRFITEDSAKDGLNWYVYCDNDPVNFVDPLGLAITCTEEDSERIIRTWFKYIFRFCNGYLFIWEPNRRLFCKQDLLSKYIKFRI